MYHHILLPVDLADPQSWNHALPVVDTLCRTFKASLTLGHVVPDTRMMLEAQWSPLRFEEIVDIARAKLVLLANTIEGLGPIDCKVETGGIYASILAIADRQNIDLIVMPAHRPAIRDYLLGSNASRVVRHARCSVLVVRP